MWSRFWDSFGAESESQASDPLSSHMQPSAMSAISPEPSASLSQLQGFSEITPNESASMVANNDDGASSILSSHRMSRQHSRASHDNSFAFKFTSFGGKTHRFNSPCNNYAKLLETVRQKVTSERHSPAAGVEKEPEWLSISYLDDENDEVLITSDADVLDAVQLARKSGHDRVKLIIQDTTTATAAVPPPSPVRNEAPPPARSQTASPTLTNGRATPRAKRHRPRKVEEEIQEEEEPLLPQELMLPAAIAFLGVVILGVFAYTRVDPRR